MLHLSLLHLPRRQASWRTLETYQAHQLIWKAFPSVPPAIDGGRSERPFLFSHNHRRTHHSLIVQSVQPPDWSFLDGPAGVQEKTFDPKRIPAGTRLRYFLRANPTVDRRGYDDDKQRRVAVGLNPELAFRQMGRPDATPVTPEERRQWRDQELTSWLARHGERGGFEVETCIPGPTINRRIVRSVRKREQPITLHEVELTGVIRIVDSAAFAGICAHGIGRGKAFGFGLLMVRPL